jgi:hypothetical protein
MRQPARRPAAAQAAYSDEQKNSGALVCRAAGAPLLSFASLVSVILRRIQSGDWRLATGDSISHEANPRRTARPRL